MESSVFPPPSSTDTGIDDLGVFAVPAPAIEAVPVAEAPPAPAPVPAERRGGLRSLFGKRPQNAEPPAVAVPAAEPKASPRRRSRALRVEAPAWAVSLIIHTAILGTLAVATLAPEVRQAVRNLNASMIDTGLSKSQAEELVHIYADPSTAPRDQAVGEVSVTATPGVGGGGLGTGSGPPSATPRVGISTSVGERTSLPGV